MNIRPLNDVVFVRQRKTYTSPGGIALLDCVVNRPWEADGREQNEGEVVAVGPGKRDKKGRRESMWGLEPGQMIAFSPNGNATQMVNGEELTVIRRDSIFGEVL